MVKDGVGGIGLMISSGSGKSFTLTSVFSTHCLIVPLISPKLIISPEGEISKHVINSFVSIYIPNQSKHIKLKREKKTEKKNEKKKDLIIS